jgi:2-C-methyl-D-erythritol 2,4-cyclodiphosphate synthase
VRVGLGYDIHAFQEAKKLVLGGVEIPHSHGLLGHSDGDALTHAICDALLGALGEGDLGAYFPSSDSRYKDMNSLHMLSTVRDLLLQKGFQLVNLDTVIIAEAPRLGAYSSSMKFQLASVLNVTVDLVNVKVKSGDKIGVVGRKEGIAAQAVCLIEAISSS